MSLEDFLFYILDVYVFVRMTGWVRNTADLKVRSKSGVRWLVPALFLVVAVLGWFRWSGTFRIVECLVLVVFAVMYWFVGSGLSEKGIVVNGTLTKWDDAGTITVKKEDHCVEFERYGRNTALYFRDEQFREVRDFIGRYRK